MHLCKMSFRNLSFFRNCSNQSYLRTHLSLPAGSLEKKLLTSTTVLVLRINKLINQSVWSECMRAEKRKGRVAHACLNGTSQIILKHAHCTPAEKTELNADALMLSRVYFNKGKRLENPLIQSNSDASNSLNFWYDKTEISWRDIFRWYMFAYFH